MECRASVVLTPLNPQDVGSSCSEGHGHRPPLLPSGMAKSPSLYGVLFSNLDLKWPQNAGAPQGLAEMED